MLQGTVTNMLDENVVQPLLVSTSAINLATECVRMILKVSSQLSSSPEVLTHHELKTGRIEAG